MRNERLKPPSLARYFFAITSSDCAFHEEAELLEGAPVEEKLEPLAREQLSCFVDLGDSFLAAGGVVIFGGGTGNPSTAWLPGVDLADCTQYYWRIAPINDVTLGPFSAARTFFTDFAAACGLAPEPPVVTPETPAAPAEAPPEAPEPTEETPEPADISVCLRNPGRTHYIFYKENCTSVGLDLTQMRGSQRAVAVDARSRYKELDLGKLSIGKHNWQAPYKSDWAIAVGSFD